MNSISTRKINIKPIENLHILFWLLKDTSWVHVWHGLGIAVIAPTILIQVFIAWVSRHERGEVLHNIAIVFWLIANSIWMVGEFYFNDGTRQIAIWFFDAGLALIAIYYVSIIFWPVHKAGEQHG